jgi:hypothetical protein
MNPAREAAALQTLESLDSERAASFLALSREPALARVVVSDASGALRTHDDCRARRLLV